MNEESSAASVDRREFVRSVAGVIALAAIPSLQRASLSVGILSGTLEPGFDAGVRLGLSEASRTATLFSRKPMGVIRAPTASALITRRPDVIIGAAEYTAAREIANECNKRQIVYLDCGTRSEAFRKECGGFVFHIEASETMYSKAAALAAGANVVLWDSSLEKYGAAQLNDRFHSTSGRSMDAEAWCGWFAIKVVWESTIRMKGEGGPGLRQYLLLPQSQFDGHKGAPLSFREGDHQLRQPLYAISPGRPPRDIPDVARAEGSIRDLLDSIGPSATGCTVKR